MIFRSLAVFYSVPRFAATLIYMLQNVEYQPGAYLRWFWRTQDFSTVMYRRQLEATRITILLRLALMSGMLLQILLGLAVVVLGYSHHFVGVVCFGLALLVSFPVVWAHMAVPFVAVGRELWIKPKEAQAVAAAEAIFAAHPSVKIAVAGSYGKTSMKELLVTVLGEGKRVAATPANKNVAVSHARFAQSLSGNEEVLVIEYGEGKPGDVRALAEMTHPTHGVITGLAPAHLDKYKTLQAAGEDIFALAGYLGGKNVYVNGESSALEPFVKDGYETYSATGALGWRVQNSRLSVEGTEFELVKKRAKLQVRSKLLGVHQIGPLSFVAALALELGLSEKQVTAGVSKTTPYEHRMQPYRLGGAWIIDDTYNGNIEGVRAGTELLAALTAKRKWYITPGLVDQGSESEAVHMRVGELIAKARPDVVVLMQNSATAFIQKGLTTSGYSGEVRLEKQPLQFYQNLEQHIAAGDVVLMQNDWTDNYR